MLLLLRGPPVWSELLSEGCGVKAAWDVLPSWCDCALGWQRLTAASIVWRQSLLPLNDDQLVNSMAAQATHGLSLPVCRRYSKAGFILAVHAQPGGVFKPFLPYNLYASPHAGIPAYQNPAAYCRRLIVRPLPLPFILIVIVLACQAGLRWTCRKCLLL